MNLKEAFQGMKEAAKPAPAPQLVSALRASRVQKTGKSSHPDFEPVKIFLSKASHKAAKRRLFDDARDFSDLMQMLLDEYLSDPSTQAPKNPNTRS